ncbi:hypothetical protein L0128_04945 [candidate division KSB1 bacterium]|nr:hypothetical protein [candidate division KSB1 bacterium]
MQSRIILTLLGLGLVFSPLFSQNIEHAWGVSAGLYENKMNEIALSYGLSNRTTLLLVADVAHTSQTREYAINDVQDNTLNETFKNTGVLFGPEIRGYFYTNRVAPFAGVRSTLGWYATENEAVSGNWDKTKQFQINVGIVYGAEYFIKGSLSVYISMNLFMYSLGRNTSEKYSVQSKINNKTIIEEHKINFSQNPALFLKIYF